MWLSSLGTLDFGPWRPACGFVPTHSPDPIRGSNYVIVIDDSTRRAKTDVRPPNISTAALAVNVRRFDYTARVQVACMRAVLMSLYHVANKNGAMSHPRLNEGTFIREYSKVRPI